MEAFRSMLGPEGVITERDAVEPFNRCVGVRSSHDFTVELGG